MYNNQQIFKNMKEEVYNEENFDFEDDDMIEGDFGWEGMDADLFFRVGDKNIHVVSNGNTPPKVITDNEDSIYIQDRIYESEEIYDFETELNPNLKNLVKGIDKESAEFALEMCGIDLSPEEDPVEAYIKNIYAETFIEMASAGFWSFDSDENGNCFLVARPKEKVGDIYNLKETPFYTDKELEIKEDKPFDLVGELNKLF